MAAAACSASARARSSSVTLNSTLAARLDEHDDADRGAGEQQRQRHAGLGLGGRRLAEQLMLLGLVSDEPFAGELARRDRAAHDRRRVVGRGRLGERAFVVGVDEVGALVEPVGRLLVFVDAATHHVEGLGRLAGDRLQDLVEHDHRAQRPARLEERREVAVLVGLTAEQPSVAERRTDQRGQRLDQLAFARREVPDRLLGHDQQSEELTAGGEGRRDDREVVHRSSRRDCDSPASLTWVSTVWRSRTAGKRLGRSPGPKEAPTSACRSSSSSLLQAARRVRRS